MGSWILCDKNADKGFHGSDLIDESNSSPGNWILGHMNNANPPVFVSGAGNLRDAAATATIRISIPANITATYDFDSAVYDLELVSGPDG